MKSHDPFFTPVCSLNPIKLKASEIIGFRESLFRSWQVDYHTHIYLKIVLSFDQRQWTVCFCGDGMTKLVSFFYLVYECVAPVILTPRHSHILVTLIIVCIRITNGKPCFPKISWINLPKGRTAKEDMGLKFNMLEASSFV